jgi:hypothetical protein
VQWESLAASRSWLLPDGDGLKTVYCQIQDNAGLIATINGSITLSTPQLTIQPSPEATLQPTTQPTTQPSTTTTDNPPNLSVIPEMPSSIIVILMLILAATATSLIYKKHVTRQKN